jgi:hypothetical protein
MLEQYIEAATAFSQPAFWDFNALCNATHDAILIRWVTDDLDLNSFGVEYRVFTPKDHVFRATFCDPVMQEPTLVTREVFASIIETVKAQAKGKYIRLEALYEFFCLYLPCMNPLLNFTIH